MRTGFNSLAEKFPPMPDPTHCYKCKARLEKEKAIKRYNKAHKTDQRRNGYCPCKALNIFSTT